MRRQVWKMPRLEVAVLACACSMAMACGSGGGRAGNGDGAFEASDEATDHADAAHEDGQRDAGDVGPGDTAFDATVEVEVLVEVLV